jgi:CelD/BcsL family acetyltransferase involved in cellulose biosynthesis
MRYEVITAGELGSTERAQWDALQESNPAIWNPFFSFGWTELIARERNDVRIVVAEEAEKIVGFFPVQRLSAITAMPVGAPLADYCGFIAAPDQHFELCAVAEALKVDRLDFSHAPKNQTSFAKFGRIADASWVADLTGGSQAYSARRKAGGGAEMLKKIQQRRRKLEREHEGVSFDSFSPCPAAYDAMVGWKRRQLAETNQPDLFDRPWISRAIRAGFETNTPDFGGAMFVVRVHGKPVACLLALRSRRALHAWFTSYDEAYASVSPGNSAFLIAVEAGADAGYAEIDFGPGDYQIKRALATEKRPIVDGYAGKSSLACYVRGAEFGLRNLAEKLLSGSLANLPGKAMRRIDYYRGLRSA